MDMKGAFDRVFTIMGILIGVFVVSTIMSREHQLVSGRALSVDCIAGSFEISAMWFTFCLTIWFIIDAFLFAAYGLGHLRNNRGWVEGPSKFVYLLFYCAYTCTILAIVATCVTIFFLMEVRYMRFYCLPRVFRYSIAPIAINLIVGCGMILYQPCMEANPHKEVIQLQGDQRKRKNVSPVLVQAGIV